LSRTLHIESAGRTEVGRCRSINEDVFALRPDLGLYLVLDGMGGHAAGELAAAIAAETMQHFYEDGGTVWPVDARGKASDPQAFLVAAAKLANARIRAHAAREPEKRGMGAAVAAVYAVGSGFCVAHAGHCRVYRLRDGRLESLTEDHRGLNAYLWKGVPLDVAERRPDKDALTRALGLKEKVDVTSRMEDVRSGDVVLICSNGLYDAMPQQQLAAVLAGRSELAATADALIAAAQARGAPDDVTCVLLRWSTASEPDGG
jgi:protein phosphatase